MSKPEIDQANQAQNNPTPKLEDLPVADAQQDEVKGGSGNNVWHGPVL